MLSGTEAFELGLVNAVVPAAELDDATRAIVNTNTADMREAFTAYIERRPPNFKGR